MLWLMCSVVEKYARKLAMTGVWLSAWMLRFGMQRLCHFFHRLDQWSRSSSNDPRRCKFQKWAVDMARREEADIVVTGHTHQGVVSEHRDTLFLNSGSCSEGSFSFLSMDTKSGAYAVNNSW